MDFRNLSGSQKAAILIQSLDKAVSKNILGSLEESERQTIEKQLSQLNKIPPNLVEAVAEEFARMADSGRPSPKRELNEPDNAKNTHDAAGKKSGAPRLQALQTLDSSHLLELLKHEHPQIIAIILTHLRSELASEVLAKLPEDTITDVAMRIVKLGKVNPLMIEEIDRVFEDILSNKETPMTEDVGGVRCMAEILTQMNEYFEKLIINEIEQDNADTADAIKQLMFTFDDLVLVDDQGLQKVLRKVETKQLAMALKAASEEVKEKVFKNMSERATDMLKEEIETLGAVRMKDVEIAQQSITKIIRELESAGDVIISGRRGEELIV